MAGPQHEKDAPDSGEAGENGALAFGLAALSGIGSAVLGAMSWPVRGAAHVFAALAHPWFAAVWATALVSNIGSLVQQVAVSWLVYDLSKSEFILGLVGVASQTPTVVLLTVGGAMADHFDRRRILVLGNSVLAGTTLILVALAWSRQLATWHLLTITAVNGAVFAMLIPAQQSLTPRLVPMSDLPNAIALNGMQFNLSRLIGPAIGGLVLTSMGAAAAFATNVVSFLPLIVVASLLPAIAASKPAGGRSIHEGMLDGWRYLKTRPDLSVIAVTFFVVGIVAAPILQILPAYAKLVYEGDAKTFTRLLCGYGAGAALGAAMLAGLSRRAFHPWVVFPVYTAIAALVALMFFRPPYAITLVMMVVIGIMMVACNNRIFAASVASTPDAVRGRVCSIQAMTFSMGLPLGSLAGGSLAERWGAPAAFGVLGLGSMAMFMAIALWVRLRGVAYQAHAISAIHPS